MNPACELCKGACCEGMAIDPALLGLPADVLRWWRLHGQGSKLGGGTYLPCKCNLLVDGKCTNYDGRPQLCREWNVGCRECRQTVRERRPKNWGSIFRLIEQQENQ